MKKIISIMLSFTLITSLLFIGDTVNADTINNNVITNFSQEINELIATYDSDEEYVTQEESNQSVIYDRLIVSSGNVISENSIDSVKGLGYSVFQYDNANGASEAKEVFENKGYTVEYDSILTCDSVTSTSETSKTWANERVESQETLNAIKASGMELSEVTVGVIDSGADYTHELLKDRIVDTSINFSSSGNENDCMDDNGHGTMVSGVIAQNTTDNVKIKPYKLFNDDHSCTTSELISVIEYILSEDDCPDIINMSFGIGSNNENTLKYKLLNQLIDRGITVVVAAGNENADAKNYFPANVDGAITVSASNESNNRCSFSNFGSCVDIAAPGMYVYSSQLGGGYRTANGTSFAAPLVASAAATVLMQNPSLTTNDIESKLKGATVQVYNEYTDTEWCGAGILNYSALYESGIIDSPVLSYSSGSYIDSIELSIDVPENSTVVYTTDGSIPSLDNGIIYDNPIDIYESTHIIAVAINNDKKSKYVGATYQIVHYADESDFTISSAGTITAYTGSYKNIIVPETINGITITGVAGSAFSETDILHIELPDTATVIRLKAFLNSSLNTIIAKGVTSLGASAFKNCNNLVNVNMPNVVSGGRELFYGCSRLTEVDFNENVEELGDLAFALTNYQNAYFPKLTGVSGIFSNANLRTADLPNAEWLSSTFSGCSYLYEINIPNVTDIDDDAFSRCFMLTKYDFSNVELVEAKGFRDSCFTVLNLPNCETLESSAFSGCQSRYISIPKVDTIYDGTFQGCEELEEVFMPNVTTFFNSWSSSYFSDCYNLKSIYLPKSTFCPSIYWSVMAEKKFENGFVPALSYVYAPNATSVADRYRNISLFKYCTNLSFVFLPKAEEIKEMPDIPNLKWYFSDAMKSLPSKYNNLVSTIGYDYVIVAPTDSYAAGWANENGHTFIPSDSRDESIENPLNVTDLGRSICTSVAGLRFGFTWDNIDEIENLASNIEYGFVYSQKGVEDLSLDKVDDVNVKSVTATNRIDHGDTTSFNLVISNIQSDYYDREITARAYVCIDGMYFYSNEQKGSFGEVANLVLADNEIDTNTKNAVKNLLEKEA